MNLFKRLRNRIRALLQAYGNRRIKRYLWNTEFSKGQWNCLDGTTGDCLYPYLEKYANQGSILDLGCGSGNTGNELPEGCYGEYIGVDISDVAIGKSQQRSEENGRAAKNRYFQSDIFSYVPAQQFDVILFRDSIYYVPQTKIKVMLERYASFLKPGGAFVVRMWSGSGKYKPIVDGIEANFSVVDKSSSGQPETLVIVFRQANSADSSHMRQPAANADAGRAAT
jgi:SAM-dependent methyltransferase